MREVIYVDELLTELMRVHPFIDVDAVNLCIDRTRKLSTHSLIEELVSRYEEKQDDKDKEIKSAFESGVNAGYRKGMRSSLIAMEEYVRKQALKD